LMDVLLAFLVNKIASCGGIAEIFQRINIREEDTQTQRFLWYDKGSDKGDTYVMRAMTFAISCAPFIAHIVRAKTAETHKEEFPLALNAIQWTHYIDDFIDSMRNKYDAIRIRKKYLKACRIMATLEAKSPWIFVQQKRYLVCMSWDPHNDMFKFLATKREVLQVLMSIFDPLGFLSCQTNGLKILLQCI
ncbi:hypothetical protein KR026_007099, partial [Drosophila bipectinata]